MTPTRESPPSAPHAARLRLFASGGERLALRIAGSCMVPRLDDGDEVWVETRRFCWPGDVIAIAHPGGRVAVHRLLGYRPTRTGAVLVTQGDSAPKADPLLPAREVVGRVVAMRRAHHESGEIPFDVSLAERARAIASYLRLAVLGAARTLRRGARLP